MSLGKHGPCKMVTGGSSLVKGWVTDYEIDAFLLPLSQPMRHGEFGPVVIGVQSRETGLGRGYGQIGFIDKLDDALGLGMDH